MMFCTAEEAKPFIRTILEAAQQHLAIVEKKQCPSGYFALKAQLALGEAFETEFIGASKEDCQCWILKEQDTAMFVEPNFAVIADARTAEDGTILMTWFREMEGVNCPPHGVLPPKPDSWWDFRIRPDHAPLVIAYLNFVDPEISFPYYFGRKKEFMDEDGVFDAGKVKQAIQEKNAALI